MYQMRKIEMMDSRILRLTIWPEHIYRQYCCKDKDFIEFIVLVRISETTIGIVLLVNFIQKEYYSFRRLCYFSIDSKNISDYKFTVGNQILKPVKKDGKYYVDFA